MFVIFAPWSSLDMRNKHQVRDVSTCCWRSSIISPRHDIESETNTYWEWSTKVPNDDHWKHISDDQFMNLFVTIRSGSHVGWSVVLATLSGADAVRRWRHTKSEEAQSPYSMGLRF